MKKMLWYPVLLMVFVIQACMMCPENVLSALLTGQEEVCMEEVRITKTEDPFREWNARGAKDSSVVRAVDLNQQDFDMIPALRRYAAAGIMLMGIEKGSREPAVSKRYFSPLTRVDATGLEPGQRKDIGRLQPVSLGMPALRDIALFLLESQIIRTYWHVESVICLTGDYDSSDIYSAFFKGIHKYFTNSYNEEKLIFSITVNKLTGTMTLEGK